MRRAGGLAAVALLIAGAFLLGFFLTRSPSPTPTTARTRDAGDRPPRLVDEVRATLRHSYYRTIAPALLRNEAVEELLEGLDDPHTEYLAPEEFQALRDRTEGSYSGIGLTVGPSRNGLLVTSAFQGPAREAGIRRGDVIVRIDGRPARGLAFERSLELVKGEKGTVVRLTVRRPNGKTVDFTVVRKEIDVPAVRARLVRTPAGKLAYLRVFSFSMDATERLERATSRLVDRGARGAVLDLRDNPGGLLTEAVETVSLYLEDGPVCRTESARRAARSYSVSGDAEYPRLPLVVLVNGGTASAAEIVAAALAENRRAVLVGGRTFGKASVQSLEPLTNGGALKLTTARYLTPSGKDITGAGIRPRAKALDDPVTRRDEALRGARKTLVTLLNR
jgi:carboxyl-terminal processing protease